MEILAILGVDFLTIRTQSLTKELPLNNEELKHKV